MKKLQKLVGLVAVLGMATFMTGCDDDDDDDDGNNNQPPGSQFAPATQAELEGQTYTITLNNGQTAVLTFPSSGRYSYSVDGGAAETGTISGLAISGDDWVGTITPDNDTGTLKPGELRLHFNNKAANTFAGTFTGPAGNTEQIMGTFTSAANPGPNPDPDPDPDPDPNPTGHPTTLNGRQLQIQNLPAGSGQELFSFPTATTFTSDIGGSGTYTYTLNGNTANFDVVYQDSGHSGDFYNLILTFTGEKTGTFSGNQHYENTDHQTSGNFSITP